MKIYSVVFFVFIASCFLNSCKNDNPSHVNLKIIQTTDIHGTIFPYDFIEKKDIQNSLATVYSYVKQVRAENEGRVILLDNGDYLQGQPSIYYYNFEDTISPHLGAEIFNFMGYDAATVGNHDIETGSLVYNRFRKQLNFPYLAANAVKSSNGEPYFEPYTIIEKSGIKVAVLGLITPGIPQWLPKKLWPEMEFEDMIVSAKKWIKVIEEKENPDLVIGMFHAGIDYSYGNADSEKSMNENATKLVAEQVPGFDIVLAGHDHKFHNSKVVNSAGDSVVLLNPGSHSRAVAYVDIDFNWDKKEGKYNKSIKADIVKMDKELPDSDFMAEFDEQYKTIRNYVDRQIGEFTKSMDSKMAYFGNSRFVDFIHNIQLDLTDANVSFSSPLYFNAVIEKGPISVSDLFKLYKYENLLYTISLTGNEIDDYLEYSSNLWFNTMKSKNDHLLKVKEREDGGFKLENKYYNFSSAAGVDYLIDVTRPEGNRVKILGFSNGKRFYSDSTYLVAVNSYRGNGGGGHLTTGIGISPEELKSRLVESSSNDIRFLIMKWIEEKQIITTKKNTNWRILPEDYYEKGRNKDMKLLFEQN